MSRRSKSSVVLRALGAATLLISLTAGSALAGEVTGKGKPTPIAGYRAHSICSFSGLNDHPDDPVEGGRVQSYGQIVRAGGKAEVPSPGQLCNGHLFPYPEAFEDGE